MELLKRFTKFINNIPSGKKICLLFIAAHLDESLEKSYLQLRRKFDHPQESQSSELPENSTDNGEYNKIEDNQQGTYNLDIFTDLRHRLKLYRWSSDMLHSVNVLKFFMVIMIVEAKFWPLEWNCRIPGRLHLHSTFTDHSHILSFSFTAIVLTWRYIASATGNQLELLNLILFSLSDDETIVDEQAMVKRLNHQMRSQFMSSSSSSSSSSKLIMDDGVIELQTILQRVLFYRLDTDEFKMYRLRPNRTRRYRRQLNTLASVILTASVFVGITFGILCIPLILQCIIFDVYYARTYPTCCPDIDRQAALGNLSGWQWTPNGCERLDRLYFLPFDLLDSFGIMLSAGFVYVLPMAISTFITVSMILHWRCIDEKIRSLLGRYKQLFAHSLIVQFRIDPITGCAPQLSSAETLIAARRGWQKDKFMAIEKADLQAIIVDFFESFRRMNHLGGTLFSYCFIIFANGILIFAYFSYRSPNFYSTIIARYLISALYLTFFANSIIVLELNRVIDHSYTNICSIMAMDGSQEAIKWTQIIDIYSHRVGTVYSIIGIKINWHLVTTLAASSISFLVVVQSYKNYHPR